eukprot:Hpha_TRINITY_DN9176_c0_g2::TRINITY_DN9176_c0_g2_i1::g.94605::m.94605/K07027/K07027; glycosyltransferase 2 family protein
MSGVQQMSSLATPRLQRESGRRSGGWRKRARDLMWPVAGVCACCYALLRLSDEAAHVTASEVAEALRQIPAAGWGGALLATAVAYMALALYDKVALLHLGKKGIPFSFVALTSFSTYAISHNVGASVLSGAAVRYRAYSTVGLAASEVAVLVALTATTFGMGALVTGGLLLMHDPALLSRLEGVLPAALTTPGAAAVLGRVLVGLVAAYLLASALRCERLTLCRGTVNIAYPRPEVAFRQLLVGPLELAGAAGIIHFALPASGHPGFITVLAIFIASFTGALASHAPGGVGIFELVFVRALPEVPKAAVMAALMVWRLFFLLIPLCLSVPIVLMFERRRASSSAEERTRSPPQSVAVHHAITRVVSVTAEEV